MESATVTKRVADSSVKSGNSEKMRYQLLNWANLLASKLTVSGERRLIRGALLVQLTHGEVDLQRADVGDVTGEGDHRVEELLGIVEGVGVLVPFADGFGFSFLMYDLLPDVKISGDVRFAVWIPVHAGEEDEEIGALAKDAAVAAGSRSVPRRSSYKRLRRPFSVRCSRWDSLTRIRTSK